MADIFISYSRKDQAFVRRLYEELVKCKIDTWVDWADIPAAWPLAKGNRNGY